MNCSTAFFSFDYALYTSRNKLFNDFLTISNIFHLFSGDRKKTWQRDKSLCFIHIHGAIGFDFLLVEQATGILVNVEYPFFLFSVWPPFYWFVFKLSPNLKSFFTMLAWFANINASMSHSLFCIGCFFSLILFFF